ncbi:MAG TPA: SDR family NAD(P)-dependent oxidoreductase [Casimicrobiaceae bacterium]|nr:SDR family NAD(P)-dependent oxidoreductase [Casimicrobiaceae bacterium]
MLRSDDKIVYITGGTSGMGLATAKLLAARGAHIVVFSRNAKEADAALKEIQAARSSDRQRVGWLEADVAERDQVLAGFARAAQEFGAPDIVINMAGIGGVAPMIDMSFETFDRIMKINLYGTRHVTEAALASMRPRGRGKIVLVGSLGGFVPIYGYTAYGTSKFAVVGFAQCLRNELKPLGIDLSCFCPGEVDTPALAAERQSTHPATVAMKRIGSTMPTEPAVQALLDGVSSNRFLIIPGLKAKLIYWAVRLTPSWLWNTVADLIVARALRGKR